MGVQESYEKQAANCRKKLRYSTEAKAIRATSRYAAKLGGKGTHAYKCGVCAGWHITHHPRERGRFK